MKSDFSISLKQLATERNLPMETVISALEAALASAYKKDNLVGEQNIAVRLSFTTGEVRVFILKTVVEEVTDPRLEISLGDAKKVKRDAALGDQIETASMLYEPGRIAAQTAKQVVTQRLREAERDLVYAEYANRAGEVVTATVQKLEGRQVILDLGRADAIMPDKEQMPTERYRPNMKVKVFIVEVARTARGPEIIVSRAHRDLLRRLFEMEVPEIYNGVVEIKAIAREPGSRSKVAVWARQEGVDAVGSCVGMRGVRIQNVVKELEGEKIDVVQWHRDPASFIANALDPAQVAHVDLNPAENTARVVVQDRQLSLAIGKEGQNARLAAKLTGWKIDITSATEADQERQARHAQMEEERRARAGVEAPVVAAAEAAPVLVPPEKQAPVGAPEPEVLRPAAEQAAPVIAAASAPAPAAEAVREEASAGQPVLTPEEEEEWLQRAIAEEERAKAAALAEAEAPAEPEAEDEEEEGLPVTADVWKVPQLVPSTGGQIRFAEDILGERGGRRGGRRDGRDDDANRARRGGNRRGGRRAGSSEE
ncbi:MAG: transcription termination/antitermination protein NusA [Chloroflexi bacterium]|nr:transcription termination/antitermination protein NusA [Chloroflexota bacterium]